MVDQVSTGGESGRDKRICHILRDLGPSCTYSIDSFGEVIQRWKFDTGNIVKEIVDAMIYMLEHTSSNGIEDRRLLDNESSNFTAVLRARWNELSNTAADAQFNNNSTYEYMKSGWNPSVFVAGTNRAVSLYEENSVIPWDIVFTEFIRSDNNLLIEENDGSFELFCGLYGCSIKYDSNNNNIQHYGLNCIVPLRIFIKEEWKNINMLSVFLLKICRMCFEVNDDMNHAKYQDNPPSQNLDISGVNGEPILDSRDDIILTLDESFIHPSIVEICNTTLSALVNEGIVGKPDDTLQKYGLSKLGNRSSNGSCGIWMCLHLVQLLISLCKKLENDEIRDKVHYLLFYEAPKYAPVGILVSISQIYDCSMEYANISEELRIKIQDLNNIVIPNRKISALSLLRLCLPNIRNFILAPLNSNITSTNPLSSSYDKEFHLGRYFDPVLLLLFTAVNANPSKHGKCQFVHDLLGQISLCYCIASITIMSSISKLTRDIFWLYCYDEWSYQIPFSLNDDEKCIEADEHIGSSEKYQAFMKDYSAECIDYFHWWFLTLDLIFAALSLGSLGSPELCKSECSDSRQSASEVLSYLFKLRLNCTPDNSDTVIFVACILDYLRARLVYMTYASADLQMVLVNRRAFLPTLPTKSPSNLKIYAARIVRRNLSLGKPQLPSPTDSWKSSCETSSFAYSCWCLSSFSVEIARNSLETEGADIFGYEKGSIDGLINALKEFERITDTQIDSELALVSVLPARDIDKINININIKDTSSDYSEDQVPKQLSGSYLKSIEEVSQIEKSPSYISESLSPIPCEVNINNSTKEFADCNSSIDIGNEVKEYFTKCYTRQVTVNDLINTIKTLHLTAINSPNEATKESKLLNAILHTLFDECRSFPKYPPMELSITAHLLGRLVHEDLLISYGNALVFVLRCILEALRKVPWTKMFCFGVIAMEQFIDRFIHFPQFLSAICNISSSLKPVIGEYIEYCEACYFILPENLRNILYVDNDTLEHLGIKEPTPPSTIISLLHPEVIALGFNSPNTNLNIDIRSNFSSIMDRRFGSLITLNLKGRTQLPSNVTMEQLQGFGLGSLEKLINDPSIIQTLQIPPEQTIEHIFTVCNTLASTNIDMKVTEIADILKNNPQYGPWFAFYLVKSRASKEKNNHSIYISFLLRLDAALQKEGTIIDSNSCSRLKILPSLDNNSIQPIVHKGQIGKSEGYIIETVTLASYDCIKALLCFASLLNDVSSYVNVLRNLGFWLGQITIGRNQPIIHKYLNPRQLVIDSYSCGCIASVLPFICKILENVKSSCFKPPNPWTNNLLYLLAEVHSVSNAKSNMFEIELLFKQLNLSLMDYIGKTDFLNLNIQKIRTGGTTSSTNEDRPRAVSNNSTYLINGNHGDTSSNIHVNSGNISNVTTQSQIFQSGTGDSQLASTFLPPGYSGSQMILQQSQAQHIPSSSSDIQYWANKVLISPSVALFQIQPSLRPLVPLALDRSIREILQVVIPRSVRIAALTTREVVGKEFAFEQDENIYKRAAHLMVAALSGSMAVAACREPLRVAFTGQLRQVLHPNPTREGEDHVLIEQVIQVICSDNIDLGCQVVEQAVIERAIEEVDDIISPGIIARRKAREAGHPFVDINYYGGPNTQNAATFWASLPDSLKYRSGSLRHLQLYKDFLQYTAMRNIERRDNGGLLPDTTGNQQPTQSVNNVSISTVGTNSNVSDLYSQHQSQQINSSSVVSSAHGNQYLQHESLSGTSSNNSLSSPIVQPPEPVRVPLVYELAYQPLMMRIEECLGQIKDIIREIALYPPIIAKQNSTVPVSNTLSASGISVNITEPIKYSLPLGSNIVSVHLPTTAHIVLSILSSLPSDHNIFYLCRILFVIGSSISHREDALIGMAQKLFKTLFDAGAAFQQSITGVVPSSRYITASLGCDAALIHIEVFLTLCHQLSLYNHEFWLKLRKEATGWFIYTIEDPKYSIDIVVGALRYDLVPLDEFDISLSSLLDNALTSLSDSNSAPGYHSHRGMRVVEFVLKLFYRSLEDWHFPIFQKLPITTQIVINRLAANSNTILQSSNISSIPVILPGSSLKPHPITVTLGDLRLRVESSLLAFTASKHNKCINDYWIGGVVPTILTFQNIIQRNTDLILTPHYAAIPYPISPSFDVIKGVNTIFDEWILLLRITVFNGCGATERNNPYRNLFLQRLSRQGLLRMDDTTEKFFTVCTERAITLSLSSGLQKGNFDDLPLAELTVKPNMDPFPLDALVRLITTMARYIDPQQMTAVVITHKFLSILVRIIHRDAENANFNQRPYYRIFYSLLEEYDTIGFNTELIHFTCMLSIIHNLQYLNPNRVPSFVYAWVQIISNNRLFPYLLRHIKGWQPYHALLLQLFIFISPYLRNVQLETSIKSIYGALLRILLVLLHDFPEFLCDYSCSFCDTLPSNCIQIRNLILSSFPRNMKLPDPFLPTLKIENLPEMKMVPRMMANYGVYILYKGIKFDIDKYWISRDITILSVILSKLKLLKEDALRFGSKYSLPVITGLLLYVGIHLPNGVSTNSNNDNNSTIPSNNVNINRKVNESIEQTTINVGTSIIEDQTQQSLETFETVSNPSLSIFLFLCKTLDMEGRFVFVSAIANFLGYPNSHTYYFSSLLLWLFAKCNDSILQEQITRVLLERLIVHRPHPWGLLITFIELIKNPKYSFWSCSFVHLAPEVEKLFQSVAQTCLGQNPMKFNSTNSPNTS
ncbi:NOT1 domain-containing protein [Cryptosporidium andersoni]|uniref:NOT1 domain-containing protein n=1 Tax=Cryptosporidium andersoni TaxID=117008 RepID=A0A1J4MPV3_9CRYT|nr:NOT1 domain-containing protein [Cryptosporidium andersoni]